MKLLKEDLENGQKPDFTVINFDSYSWGYVVALTLGNLSFNLNDIYLKLLELKSKPDKLDSFGVTETFISKCFVKIKNSLEKEAPLHIEEFTIKEKNALKKIIKDTVTPINIITVDNVDYAPLGVVISTDFIEKKYGIIWDCLKLKSLNGDREIYAFVMDYEPYEYIDFVKTIDSFSELIQKIERAMSSKIKGDTWKTLPKDEQKRLIKKYQEEIMKLKKEMENAKW